MNQTPLFSSATRQLVRENLLIKSNFISNYPVATLFLIVILRKFFFFTKLKCPPLPSINDFSIDSVFYLKNKKHEDFYYANKK